jgi:cytoskeleton protein RodZ
VATPATAPEAPPAEPAPAPAADAANSATDQPSAAAAVPATEQATLVLSYRDFSWTDVRDGNGRVLAMKMMKAGEQQSLTGTPPFEVVIGNSADVKLTYRGQPVDLGALSRGNVARFTLK